MTWQQDFELTDKETRTRQDEAHEPLSSQLVGREEQERMGRGWWAEWLQLWLMEPGTGVSKITNQRNKLKTENVKTASKITKKPDTNSLCLYRTSLLPFVDRQWTFGVFGDINDFTKNEV